MTYGIYQATSGAVARLQQVDVVANNLANRDTPGFRRNNVTFETVLRDVQAPDRQFVVTSETYIDVESGRPVVTGRPTDFALAEAGYVRARGRGGEVVLLRTSSLNADADGHLVDGAGRWVEEAGGGPIRLEPEIPFELREDGVVLQAGQPIGRLRFQDVAEPRLLRPVAEGGFAVTDRSGATFDVNNRLVTGHLESSNVNAIEGMVKLIQLERGYQASMKVIQAYREADEQLIERTSR